MAEKVIWKSKTFWVAMAALALGILTEAEKLVSTEVWTTLLAVVMILLRNFTKEAVKWKFW